MPTCRLTATSHGVADLHYETRGSGRPLLFVAGLGGLGSFWNAQLEVFARTRRVITFDHRGTGASTHSRIQYSVGQMADDTLGLLDHLGLPQVDYVGHSTGGAIGQYIAARAPARLGRLVLSSTWARADAYFRRLFELRKAVLLWQGVRAYTHLGNLLLYPADYFAQHASAIDARAEASLQAPSPPDVLASRIDAILEFDGWDAASAISHRTLVLCARDDAVTPPYLSEALAARLQHARLELLARGGHFCPVTQTAAYNALLADFLAAS